MFRKLVLVVVLFASILLLAQPTHSFAALTPEQQIAKQQADLGKTYLTGTNSKRCVNILEGRAKGTNDGPANFLQWTKIFDVGWWIPVVPEECVVCIQSDAELDKKPADRTTEVTSLCPYGNNSNVPLPLNVIPQIAIRLYGMLASITIYGLVLVFAIVGIRFLIGGLSKGGRYTDTAKNLRDVFSALVITLTIATLFLQLLFSVLKVNQKGLVIDEVCIPPQKLVKAADGKQSCVNP
jgi:hypothetical protein